MTNHRFDSSRGRTSSSRGSGEASTAADVRGETMRAAEGRAKTKKKKNRSPGPVSVSDGGDVAGGEIARPKQRRKQRRSASPVSDSGGGGAASLRKVPTPPVVGKKNKLSYKPTGVRHSKMRSSKLFLSEDDDFGGGDAQAAGHASTAPSGRKVSMPMTLQGEGKILQQDDTYLSDPPTNAAASSGERSKLSYRQKWHSRIRNLALLSSEVRDNDLAGEVAQAARRASAAPSGGKVSMPMQGINPLLGTGSTQIFQQDDPHLSDPQTNRCRFEEAKKSSIVVTSGTLPLETKQDIRSPARSVDLGDIAGENAEQLDKIPNVIDHKQEKGLEEIEGLDWNDTKLKKEIDSCLDLFTYKLPSEDDEDFWYYHDEEQLKSLKKQVALHRIRAHRILNGAKLEELKDAELMKDCTSEVLEDEGYYRYFESDFEWYFDPEYCEHAGFQDYQRLVLHNNGDYLDWNYYHEILSTHEGDQEYVEFYENLLNKTKWIVNFLGADKNEWRRYLRVAFYHAVKNAASYPNIFERLIYFGFQEYLWSIRFDNVRCKQIASIL